MASNEGKRQQVLVLYLQTSALDSGVIGWSQYDGRGEAQYMAGDQDAPPYKTGLHALRDGCNTGLSGQHKRAGTGIRQC